MVLNVSGRTDIVAFYSDWFMNRIKEGFVDVRNPFNKKLVSRIYFEDVDLILFCTKNPIPILDKIEKINKPILFHVTLTPYKRDIEVNVPPKGKIIEAIKKLSNIIGKDNICVRYDPIFISDEYTLDYHIRNFDKLCTLLNGYVKIIIVSFIDDYKNVRKNMKSIRYRNFTENDYKMIGESFSLSAKKNNMTVQTCFEERNLIEYGFKKGECLSHTLAFKLTGKTDFKSWTARKGGNCKCVQMVDIGAYNTCSHFCKYCYANYDEKMVKENIILRLTALFHDIGKPYTYTEDENNIGHFYNHWNKSCEIFLNFSKKYKLQVDLTNEVNKLIYYHDINISKLNREELNKFLDEFSVDEINMLYEIKKSDLLAQSPKYHYLLDEYALQKENLLMKKIPK